MNFYTFKRLYYLTDSQLFVYRTLYTYNLKIKKLLRKNGKGKRRLVPEDIVKIGQYFKKYGFKKISTKWHLFYSSVNGIFSNKYIPETLFYSKIEPSLNRGIMVPALEDKNLMETLFSEIQQPKTIIKNINSSYYHRNKRITPDTAVSICAEYDYFVIKPSLGSSGGNGVELIARSDENDVMVGQQIEKLFAKYGNDFIVQEVIKQHKWLTLLNPTSVNTIRILSFLRDREVVILSSIIRIGRLNCFVDNTGFGGLACGIKKNGTLEQIGYDKYGRPHYKTSVGTVLHNFKIPFYERILQNVQIYHERIPFFKLVSWDITVGMEDNEVILIEFNSMKQGINAHQLTNGPLFGAYTDEILNYVSSYDLLSDRVKFSK